MNTLRRCLWPRLALALACLAMPMAVQASVFAGEALDTVANVLAWVVLIVAPVIALTLFWLVHILPEKIAEKKHHPQAKAIQVLCLLSLVFGGLLWPLAWLWAYSKPVLYKMAYGTDRAAPEGREAASPPDAAAERAAEIARLRSRLAELEGSAPATGGQG